MRSRGPLVLVVLLGVAHAQEPAPTDGEPEGPPPVDEAAPPPEAPAPAEPAAPAPEAATAPAAAEPPTGGRILQVPKLIKHPAPTYPPSEREAGAGAEVLCSVVVEVDGRGMPGAIEVGSDGGCTEPFQQATREALAGWRWSKTGQEGVVPTHLKVRFRVQ